MPLHERMMGEADPPPSPDNDTSSPPSPPTPTPTPPTSSSSPPPSPPAQSPPTPSPPTPPPSPPPSPPTPTPSPPPTPDTPSTPPSKETPPQSPPPPTPTNVPTTTPPHTPPLTPGTHAPPVQVQTPPGQAIAPPSPITGTPPGQTNNSSVNDSSLTSSSSSSSASPGSALPIVGGVLGAAVLILALVILGLVCSRKNKKKRHYQNDPYYKKPTTHYNQSVDHVVKFPSPPSPLAKAGATTGAGGGWGTSSDNSSGYSGQQNQQQHSITPSPLGGLGGYSSQNQFSYQELASATSGFSQENLLGQGGFGYVHKGVLANGRVVAVKSLKSGSGQGEREFQAEVEIISRVHHRHLVSLVGYCIADAQRMLVYEFVPNKTLEHHLHGKGVPVMDWSCRMRIALGSAKGLAYLHEDCHPRIIHRDIKAANILLDDNYEAMVADFGLAKLSSDNFTHVSTRVMGTFGYLAPEYASSGKLSEKSDVFSFGVMLLELITGRKPVDHTNKMMDDSLVDWSRPLMAKALEDGNYEAVADPRMEGNYLPYEMARMVACASASVRHSAKRRPRMSQIVRSLEGDLALEDLNEGVKHLIKPTNTTSPSTSSHDSVYDTGAYNADMMKFRKMIMTTQETPSNEYGTSDYDTK
ncbi:hypothetical protein Leryth_008215 [Lithospermum erythrorhizon]|nr:hypothetical protein Leryth_008215 [Lithospermum erythrorhizon]